MPLEAFAPWIGRRMSFGSGPCRNMGRLVDTQPRFCSLGKSFFVSPPHFGMIGLQPFLEETKQSLAGSQQKHPECAEYYAQEPPF